VARPRPATAAESSTCGRGNAVGRTSILDRGKFFSFNARRPAIRYHANTHCPSVLPLKTYQFEDTV